MKKTSNAESSTPNVELQNSELGVGRWALGVGRLLGHKFLWRILDLIVGGVFIYAGVIKALDPIGFANDIDNYKILPWTMAAGLSFYLPWLEMLCGLALLFRVLYRGGLSILTALLLVFISATIAAKARGLDITCGCFGHASQHWSFPAHMAVDLAIFAGVIGLWFAACNWRQFR